MLKNNKASLIQVGGGGAALREKPLAFYFGLTPMALPHETWPMFKKERPFFTNKIETGNLFFICQLNLAEAPLRT